MVENTQAKIRRIYTVNLRDFDRKPRVAFTTYDEAAAFVNTWFDGEKEDFDAHIVEVPIFAAYRQF